MWYRLVSTTIAFVLSVGPGLHPVAASVALVPDDVSTIQAAIDSGVDTVLIRVGTYPERPVVDRPVVLQAINLAARPRLDGMSITNANFWTSPRALMVSGIDFAGRVEHATVDYHPRLLELRFADCSLEAGFYQVLSTDPQDVAVLAMRNCRLGSASRARASQIVMEADTIDGGVAWMVDDARIQQCWFRGGTGVALELSGQPSGAVADNRIENYDVGIHLRDARLTIRHNAVSGCGTGIYIGFTSDWAYLIDNASVGAPSASMPVTSFTTRAWSRTQFLEAISQTV